MRGWYPPNSEPSAASSSRTRESSAASESSSRRNALSIRRGLVGRARLSAPASRDGPGHSEDEDRGDGWFTCVEEGVFAQLHVTTRGLAVSLGGIDDAAARPALR